jgi:hypothetical protein
MGGDTWSVTLREEHMLRLFENMVVRKIFGPTRDVVVSKWRIFTTRSFAFSAPYQTLFGRPKQEE